MKNEQKKESQKQLNEGIVKKGGVNERPVTPPPVTPPKGQGGKKLDGIKFDGWKLRVDLAEPLPELLFYAGLTYGNWKYDKKAGVDKNFKLVENADERYYAADRRHELYGRLGEDFDKDSGLPHAVHEMANAYFKLVKLIERNNLDISYLEDLMKKWKERFSEENKRYKKRKK